MSDVLRVLVTGSRTFSDARIVDAVLTGLWHNYGSMLVIAGGAKGADDLAGRWCDRWEFPLETWPADWEKHGKAAGPIRNQKMLDRFEGEPDLVLAFVDKPLEESKGTADMVRRARKAGVQVYVVQAMGAES